MNRVLYLLRDVGLLKAVPDQLTANSVLSRSKCFLHDGSDNPHALLLFGDGYACTTHGCHKDRRFGSNLEGLIRHMAYRLTGQIMSWIDAWRFARRSINKLKALVGGCVRHSSTEGSPTKQVEWTKDQLLDCLDIPCPHFLKRGFRPETLAHFNVGSCVRSLPDGKRLVGWTIVPILGRPDLPPQGYTARNPRHGQNGQTIKWLNQVKKSQVLYNDWNASLSSGPLVITEGVPNVLRLFEAGLAGAVATLGSSLSQTQFFAVVALLRGQPVYIAADNDEAGRTYADQVQKQLAGVCDPRVIFAPDGLKDFGDCSADGIRLLDLA
jgi:hypothetical protein